MNNIKLQINNFLHYFGYHVSKAPYSKQQIESGHFKWLQDFGVQTILDIGANEGQFIEKISMILPSTYIYSFEPLKQPFEKLKNNTSRYSNITVFNFALGDVERESVINRNDYSPSSSLLELTDLHKKAFPITEKVTEEKIQVKILDSVAPNLNLKKKIFMKIDVQGYELNVLRGAERMLSDVDIILTETSFYELYKDQPLFGDVYKFLCDRGFKYFGGFEQLNDERDGRILQADSIFIRG